ncbi:hypothetical protein N7454_005419 [Penicillium verhagenii]|nr:hypothetical protein N7454_005419 [Penicillium verhagenii]
MTTIVFITGANTGIGFETVKALAASHQPYTIILGSRSLEKAKAAIVTAEREFPDSKSDFVSLQVDIEHDDSINRAFSDVQSKYGRIDVLINNAARAKFGTKPGTSTQPAPRSSQPPSHPLLLQSANPRLLFITSGTSTLAGTENQAIPVNRVPAKGWPKSGFNLPAYRSAKTGLNMLMREWHRWLKEDGVKVWGISPGFLATGLGGDPEAFRKMGAGDPAVAGPFIRSVVEGERDGDVGRVISRDGVQAW